MKFSHWNTAITSRPEWRAVCKTVCTKYDPFVPWNFEPLHVMRGGGTSVHIPSRTWFPSAGKAFEPDPAHIDHRSDIRREADDTLWNVSTNNIPSGRVVPDGVGNCTRIFDSSTDGVQLNNDDVIEHAIARNIVGALHTTTSQPLLTKSDQLSCCIEFPTSLRWFVLSNTLGCQIDWVCLCFIQQVHQVGLVADVTYLLSRPLREKSAKFLPGWGHPTRLASNSYVDSS